MVVAGARPAAKAAGMSEGFDRFDERTLQQWEQYKDQRCPPHAPYRAINGTGCVEKPIDTNYNQANAQFIGAQAGDKRFWYGPNGEKRPFSGGGGGGGGGAGGGGGFGGAGGGAGGGSTGSIYDYLSGSAMGAIKDPNEALGLLGMSGGIAYVLDTENTFFIQNCNSESLNIDPITSKEDESQLKQLIQNH